MIWYDLITRTGPASPSDGSIMRTTVGAVLRRYCERERKRPVRLVAAYTWDDDRGSSYGIAVELEDGEAWLPAIPHWIDTIQYQPGSLEMLDAARA